MLGDGIVSFGSAEDTLWDRNRKSSAKIGSSSSTRLVTAIPGVSNEVSLVLLCMEMRSCWSVFVMPPSW